MNIKRMSGSALVVTALAMLLAGCGGTPAPAPPMPTASPVANLVPTTPATAPTVAVAQVSPAVTSTTSSAATLTPAAPATPTNPNAPSMQPGDTPLPTEQPVAAEQSPAGDIPDTQAYVTYTNALGGYSLAVPEGWARTERGADVSFSSKLDGVSVSITDTAATPTAASADSIVALLKQRGRAVEVSKVTDVQLPGGPAVLITYTSNSDPNPVTNKQVRLENNAYLFWEAGKLATLTLYAPLGADNVDQWKYMAESFRWAVK